MNYELSTVMRKIIGVNELSDFKRVEERLASINEGFIFQNNAPTHVIMTLEYYEQLNATAPSVNIRSQDGLETLLNKIGKKIFVDYYDCFKYDSAPESALESEGFTLASRRSRSSSARTIFRNSMQIDALNNIIASDKLEADTVNKAKHILASETGSITNEESSDIEDLYQVKIGKMMKASLTKLISNGKISDDELLRLQSPLYSKETLNLNFPVLKLLQPGQNSDEAKRDAKGYNRYYDSIISYNDNKYLICSQWVDNLHHKNVVDWLTVNMVNILVELVKNIPSGEEFEIRKVLAEYWTYIDHSVKNAVGRASKPAVLDSNLAKLVSKKGNRQIYVRI